MRVAEVTIHVVREIEAPFDNRQLCALVVVTADNGLTGYAEANANPAAIKAFIDSGLGLIDNWDDAPRAVLARCDASDPRAAWEALSARSFWSCRAGIGYIAIAALGTALWDLAGKIAGRPVHELVEKPVDHEIVPYLTLYHGRSGAEETMARNRQAIEWALDKGFRAAKVEALEENVADESRILDVVADARAVAGDEMVLLVDVGYRWRDVKSAIMICNGLAELGVHAIEAPFPPDRIAHYRALADGSGVAIATGDVLSAPVEYEPLIDSGAVAIVQAGAARSGFNGLLELSGRATSVGVRVVTWGWCATTAAVAANLHASMTFPGRVLLEYAPPSLYPDARIRSELFFPEPTIRDGICLAPGAPGFGVELDQDALAGFSIASQRWAL